MILIFDSTSRSFYLETDAARRRVIHSSRHRTRPGSRPGQVQVFPRLLPNTSVVSLELCKRKRCPCHDPRASFRARSTVVSSFKSQEFKCSRTSPMFIEFL